jgi:hypothetical protein
MLFEQVRRVNHIESEVLCIESPEVFMICPRCNGTKWEETGATGTTIRMGYKTCTYCNGHGVLSWIDKVIRGKKNPFTEGEK